jgi:hypothetical protein
MIWSGDLAINKSEIWQGWIGMPLVQFLICLIAPVVLFQDRYILLGVVAVVNLLAHSWSFTMFLKATGVPPGP